MALSESGSDVGIENVKRAYDVLIDGGNILIPLGPLPWSTCCANVVDRFGVF